MVVTTGKMRYRHCSGKYRSPMIENFDSVYKTSINTDGDFTMRRLAAMLCLTFCWMTLGAPLAVGGEHMTMEQLRAKYGDRKAKIALIGGVEVYYKDEGKGPAILMVHGSQSTLKTWDYVATKLTHRYRVIRYDIPPQGLSGHVSDAAAKNLQPTDIAEGLLKQLGVDKITYVGVSSGGTLGVFLAAKRPDLVQRLILSNTPADTVTTAHLPPSPSFDQAQREAKETGFQSQFFWNEFLSYFAGDPKRLDANIREQYYDVNRRTPEPNYLALVAKVADQVKAKDAMSKVRAPTLLVWGARDPLLVPASADALASYLTGAQVSKIMLPDVGHYPPLEVPARFADIIANYIEAVTP
jgi:pimeloyl-ACP methyl ester carboxylesterase